MYEYKIKKGRKGFRLLVITFTCLDEIRIKNFPLKSIANKVAGLENKSRLNSRSLIFIIPFSR